MPATPAMIAAVRGLIKEKILDFYVSDDLTDLEMSVVATPDLAASKMLTLDMETQVTSRKAHTFHGIDYRASNAVRLMLPLLGGFAVAEIEEFLPYALRAVGEKMPLVKSMLDRLLLARPPPISRTALLVALHRSVALRDKLLGLLLLLC
jgi:hypothetical protein